MDMIRLSLLGSWLSLPVDRRPPLNPTPVPEFQGLTFTEDHKILYHGEPLSRIGEEPGRYSYDFASLSRDMLVDVITNANLTDRGKCGGYTVYASTVAVIALHKRVGYWLQLEIPDSPRRIRDIRCDRGHIIVERSIGPNLLATADSHASTDRVVFDIANGWFKIAQPPF